MASSASRVANIFGYGSLMDAASARTTCPLAANFQPAVLLDYKRHFNLVSLATIKCGRANFDTNELAALSIRSCMGEKVFGVVFEIPEEELPAYLEREARYKAIRVRASTISVLVGQRDVECWTVVEQSDEEYRATMSVEEYDSKVAQFYSGKLWGRKDIFPIRDYLNNCIAAARLINSEFLNNFLDHTVLSDDVTTIRKYLLANPSRLDTQVNANLF